MPKPELVQTLDPGVCSFRARQAVCILPPKQNMAIWSELRGGIGTLLARGIFTVVILRASPLCHPQTSAVGRDRKPCVSGLRQCLVTAANRPGMDLGRFPNSSAFSKAGSGLRVSHSCYPGNLSHKAFAAVRIGVGADFLLWDLAHLVLTHLVLPQSQHFGLSCVSGLDTVKSSLKSSSSVIALLSCMSQVWGLTGKTKFESHCCGPEPASSNYSNISC